ncbi:Ribonuclease H2 subunit C, partial [Stegodyphus mimosarum]
MSMLLNLESEGRSLESVSCHLMPCKIEYDGNANVSKFYASNIREENGVLKSSFRGHPLQGQIVQVPNGYKGVVLEENPKFSSSEDKREFKIKGTFEKFTAWNWDKIPSHNDKLIKALQWIDIASALHTSVSQYKNEQE